MLDFTMSTFFMLIFVYLRSKNVSDVKFEMVSIDYR